MDKWIGLIVISVLGLGCAQQGPAPCVEPRRGACVCPGYVTDLECKSDGSYGSCFCNDIETNDGGRVDAGAIADAGSVADSGVEWSDPSLSGLTLSRGSLAFSPSQTAYVVELLSAAPETVMVSATAPMPSRVTLDVQGAVVASGAATPVALSERLTLIQVRVRAESGAERTYVIAVVRVQPEQQQLLKASNAEAYDIFGSAMALSGDGLTLAVYAGGEDGSGAGGEGDNSTPSSGAVYVFVRTASGWVQQARLKASNANGADGVTQFEGDLFGASLALSFDGSLLVIGARGEDGAPDAGASDNSMQNSGAAYVFRRTGSSWSEEQILKASNANLYDAFGSGVAVNGAGTSIAVGAPGESASLDGGEFDNTLNGSGAVYLFTRVGAEWRQQRYLKVANSAGAEFGTALALDDLGNTLLVGAPGDSVAGSQTGSAYLLETVDAGWAVQATLVASYPRANDDFGSVVALSRDGDTAAIGAPNEKGPHDAGAVYVFTRQGGWSPGVFIEGSNTEYGDSFGHSVSLSTDGRTLAVGALGEDSFSPAFPERDDASKSGAAYVFTFENGAWVQRAFVKPALVDNDDRFGGSVMLGRDGRELFVGAHGESSPVPGLPSQNSATSAGAAYWFSW